MPRPWIGSLMGQVLAHTQLLRHKSPVLVEPFEFPDEIGEHISICINEPIQLVTVRRLVNASGAAVLNPIDKFVERHLFSELQRLSALVKRDDAVPRIANESEFEVGLELFASDFSPALFRK